MDGRRQCALGGRVEVAISRMAVDGAVWVLCARARGAAAAESVASAIHEAWVTAGSQFTGWGGTSVHGWLRAHVTRNSIAVALRW